MAQSDNKDYYWPCGQAAARIRGRHTFGEREMTEKTLEEQAEEVLSRFANAPIGPDI